MANIREIKNRIDKLKKILFKKKIDALFLYYGGEGKNITQANIFYFTGIWFLEPVILIISSGFSSKIQDCLYTSFPLEDRTLFEGKKMRKKTILFENKKITIGIDEGLSFAYYKKLKNKYKFIDLKDITVDILKLRSIKSENEIKHIKTACYRQKEIISKLERQRKKLFGLSEKQLQKKIDILILEHECTNAFNTLAAADKNTGFIHHLPSDYVSKKCIMLDFGLNCNHYNSDMTRMFFSSQADDVMRKAYFVLEEIHERIEKFIKPGISFSQITEIADSFLKKDYSKYSFSNFHSIGHGVGLQVHEYPNYSDAEGIMEKNMVFTIEPGIYIKNKFGIRLENVLVMRKNKVEQL